MSWAVRLKRPSTPGVAKGYTEGYLRKSSVAEPLFERKNTGTTRPPCCICAPCARRSHPPEAGAQRGGQ